jgi:lysozyme
VTTGAKLAAPLIRKSEGLRLVTYRCPAGKWTIGYGHTKTARPGMKITVEDAERLLAADMADCATAIRKRVRVALTAGQEAALIDFIFNFGETNFATSTFLRLLNAGNYAAVPAQLLRWVYSTNAKTGKKEVMRGLEIRRAAEVTLWNTKA